LGQHFLTDRNIAEKISSLLKQWGSSYELVLEVGPGQGFLTKSLLQRFGENLYLVEIDHRLKDELQLKFGLADRIITIDFLEFDPSLIGNKPFGLIGNFPYNVSSQILFKVLEHRMLIPEMAGMFQKEVARRICSGPNSKEYGILSVMIQAYYKPIYQFTVSPAVFSPPPKVNSAVITLERLNDLPENLNHSLFHKIVRTSFNQRRKILGNSLHAFNGIQCPELRDYKGLRPEQLSVGDFVSLTFLIEQHGNGPS
jgi:16S rRNA (adenine1518-N6/adenine1519-N6)-dimethyltransferase